MFVVYWLVNVAPECSVKTPRRVMSRRRRPNVRACCLIVVGKRSASTESKIKEEESASTRRERESMADDESRDEIMRQPCPKVMCIYMRHATPAHCAGRGLPLTRSLGHIGLLGQMCQLVRRADG
jgi:hypothetical protein